jgi:hypothetical protein
MGTSSKLFLVRYVNHAPDAPAQTSPPEVSPEPEGPRTGALGLDFVASPLRIAGSTAWSPVVGGPSDRAESAVSMNFGVSGGGQLRAETKRSRIGESGAEDDARVL